MSLYLQFLKERRGLEEPKETFGTSFIGEKPKSLYQQFLEETGKKEIKKSKPVLKAEIGEGLSPSDILKLGKGPIAPEKVPEVIKEKIIKPTPKRTEITGESLEVLLQYFLRGFVGRPIAEFLEKKGLIEPAFEPETTKEKIAATVGEMGGGIASVMLSTGIARNVLTSIPSVAGFARLYPRIFNLLTLGLTGSALGQIKSLPFDASFKERLKQLAIDLPSWIAWGIVGGTPAKKFYKYVPGYFTVGFVSSKLEGADWKDAFYSGLASAAIGSLFKIAEIPKETQKILQEKASDVLKKYGVEIEKGYREYIKKYHPDKFFGTPQYEEMNKKLAQINLARKILKEGLSKTQKGLLDEIRELWRNITHPSIPREKAVITIPFAQKIAPKPTPEAIITPPPKEAVGIKPEAVKVKPEEIKPTKEPLFVSEKQRRALWLKAPWIAKVHAHGIRWRDLTEEQKEAVKKWVLEKKEGLPPEIKPAGEIKEKFLGGRPKLEEARLMKDVSPIRRLFEKFIPTLRKKRLEKMLKREIVEKIPDDIHPVFQLFYKLAPRRVQFSHHPKASEMVIDIIKAKLNREAERFAIDEKYSELEKFFKGKEKDYELLTDYIELGLTDEAVKNLPERFSKVILERRKLERELLRIIQEDLKIDTSKWRFTPENYFHHFWPGDWEVYNKKSNKRLFFGKFKKAVEFFEKYLIENPNADIVIRKRAVPSSFTTTQLSQPGFWKFVSEVSKYLEITPDDVLDDITFRGIAAIKRKRVFVGAFMPRLANLGGYLKNPFVVDRIIWNKVLKKKYLEPLSKSLRLKLNELPPNTRADVEKYINLIEKEGMTEPSFWYWAKIANKITKLQANLKLGYRPVSAIVNRLQDVQFTLPDVGLKTWLRGKMLAHTSEGKELIKKSNILVAPLRYEMGEWKKTYKVKWWKPLGIFSASEQEVRSEAFMERFLEGYLRFNYKEVNKNFKKYGINKNFKNQEDMALDYAIRAIASDMGYYGIEDFPELFTKHPLLRIPFQFKFVPTLWLDKAIRVTRGLPPAGTEIFFETNPYTPTEKIARFVRFWTINLGFSGVRIFDLLLKWVFPVGLAYMLLKRPRLSNGVFALLGLDVSRSFSPDPFSLIDINKKWWEMLGIPVSDIIIIMKALKDKNLKLLTQVSPQLQRVVSAVLAEEGKVINFYTDIPQAKLSTFERIMLGLGFTPLTLTKARDLQTVISIINDEYKKVKKQIETAREQEDYQKAKFLQQDWNKKIKDLLPFIYQRMAEIRKKELTSNEKNTIRKRFIIDTTDILRWKKEKKEQFGVEKLLKLK